MPLIVTAGSVTVETNVGPGRARVDFFRGQTLPDDLTQEDRERVLRFGQAEEVEAADDAAPEFDPATLGQANIVDTMLWVGDDKAKAQQALDAEIAEGGKNRKTLVEALKATLEPPA